MNMYRFENYGSLWRYNGTPMWLAGRCITDRAMVWWFPWNWVIIVCALPIAFYRALREKKLNG